jgi:hypothetical protein
MLLLHHCCSKHARGGGATAAAAAPAPSPLPLLQQQLPKQHPTTGPRHRC